MKRIPRVIVKGVAAVAGLQADEARLKTKGLKSIHVKKFDPHFNNGLRAAAYQAIKNTTAPSAPTDLDSLVAEQ
jgi:hypothetical protein